jgi:phage antirepressor YoqD-like protein
MIDDPIKRAERWIEEAKERKALEDKNRVLTKQAEEMKPKSDYFNSLVDSNLLTNFRDTAKELGYSQTEFTGWILEKGYIYKDNAGIIKPYEPYRKQVLFVMKDFKNKYSGYSGVRTYVTVKGKNTFRLLMQVPDETVVLY